MMSGDSTSQQEELVARTSKTKKKFISCTHKPKKGDYITITHEKIVVAYLRTIKTEIDGELQWVVAATDFANILTHVTNQTAIASRTFPQAGVVHRKTTNFGCGQACKPLTAFDACQYLSHITNKHEDDKSIITNAIQLFTQLLIVKTNDSTTTAMWRLDLTEIKSIALPHAAPWLRETNSSASTNKNEALNILYTASMEIESKTNHSATTDELSASAIDAALRQLSSFLRKKNSDSILNLTKIKKKIYSSKDKPRTKTSLTLDYLKPENCSLIEITYNNIAVANLRFLKTEIDEEVQWVVARHDFVNIISDIIRQKRLATKEFRGHILFGLDQQASPLTALDACQYLYRTIQRYNDLLIQTNALQLFLQLLLIKIDDNNSSISAAWKAEPTQIKRIALSQLLPWLVKEENTSISLSSNDASNMEIESKTNHLNGLTPSVITTAMQQLAALYTSQYNNRKASSLAIAAQTPEEYHYIQVIDCDSSKTNLRFKKAILNGNSDWVISAADLTRAIVSATTVESNIDLYIANAGIEPRPLIRFKNQNTRWSIFTANDVAIYLVYMIITNNGQVKANARQLYYQLISGTDGAITWHADIQNKKSIVLAHSLPLMDTTPDSVSDAKTKPSETSDEPPIKNSISTPLMSLPALTATKSNPLYETKEPTKKKTSTTAVVKSLLASSLAISSPPVNVNPSLTLPTQSQSSTAETKIAATLPLSTLDRKKYKPKTMAALPRAEIENLLALTELAIMQTPLTTGKRALPESGEDEKKPANKRQKI